MSLIGCGKFVCEKLKGYVRGVKLFVSHISSRSFCKYNGNHIEKQLNANNGSAGVDFFSGTVDVSSKSMEVILNSLLSNEKVGHILTKHLVNVRETTVGSVNNFKTSFSNSKIDDSGFEMKPNESKKSRPFYDRAFEMRLEYKDDESERFYVYLSNSRKSGKGKAAIRFAFVPSKFKEYEIAVFFNRISVALGARTYKRLINKIRFTRLDFKYDIKNVSPFSIFFRLENVDNESVTLYPQHKSSVIETVCMGNIKKSNVAVGYNKNLQLFVKGLISYEELIAESHLYRYEYRNFPYRVRCPNRISKIVESGVHGLDHKGIIWVNTGFDKVWFLNPKYLYLLPKSLLKELLTNVTVEKLDHAANLIRTKKGPGCDDIKLRFSDNINSIEVQKLIHDLFKTILNPNSILKQYNSSNYLTVVNGERTTYAENIVPVRNNKRISILKAEHDKTVDSIIKDTSRLKVITAGAGSGKTELCKQQLDYWQTQDINMRNVVMCAFTKKSVKEFKGRCAKKAYRRQVSILTFSAFCSQEYNKYAECSKKVIEEKDIIKIIGGLLKKHNLPENIDAGEVYRLYSTSRHRKQTLRNLLANSKKNAEIYERCFPSIKKVLNEYEGYKTKNNLWEFYDMFPQFASLLEMDKDVAEDFCSRFTHFIIDEVQDNSRDQWRIVEVMLKHQVNLLLVGDFAQAIFRFRGAEPEYLNRFKKRAYAQHFTLSGCYRSTAPVIGMTNFIRHSIDPKLEPSKSLVGLGEKPALYEADTIKNCAEAIIFDLKNRKKNDLISKKIFIIGRTHRTVDSIEKAIKKVAPDAVIECLDFDSFHGTKGKQADICYVVDPRFSYYPWAARIEEESNLFVAVSRAKSELIIVRCLNGFCNYLGETSGKHILDSLPTNLFDFKSFPGK